MSRKTKLALIGAMLLTLSSSPAVMAKPKPLGVVGVIYGVTVGVPVKIVSDVFSESKRMTQTLQSDFDAFASPNKSLSAMIYLMSIPYGVVSGSILGSVHGVTNAIKYGYEEPFSKSSISLGAEEVAMKDDN